MADPQDLKRLKERAKKLKIRITKNVNGRRVPLTAQELKSAIDKKKKKEIKDEIKEIIKTGKDAGENAKNEFFNASNEELENVFFNANNTPFNLRNDFEDAIKKKDGKLLIDKAMRDLEVKGVDKSVMSAMKRDAVKTANYIRDLIKSGQILKAFSTISLLFAAYKLYQNPTFVDRTLLNYIRGAPFMKPVLSDPRKGKIGWFLSVAGFDPTKKEQTVYELLMSNVLDNKVPGRSVAGIATSYLTMVILSLVSILPYTSTRGTSVAALKLIFKLIEQSAPMVGKIIVDKFASTKMTAQGRVQTVLTILPQLFGVIKAYAHV